MARALEAIDSLADGPGQWTFGGGTALARDLDHRVSYDVDIFLDSSRTMKLLSPNVNPATRALCDTWHWPGNYLKLIVSDLGEIDFLNSSTYTDDPTAEFLFDGRTILKERPCEIIAKKLIYRASTYKERDMFDLAATWLFDRDEVFKAAASPFLPEMKIKAAIARVELGRKLFQSNMRSEINPTERGETFIDGTCGIALEALDAMLRVHKPGLQQGEDRKPG